VTATHWVIEPSVTLTKAAPEFGQPSESLPDQVVPLVPFQLNEISLELLKPAPASRLPEVGARQTQLPPVHEPPGPQFAQLDPQWLGSLAVL
jgi:hypothetical protein